MILFVIGWVQFMGSNLLYAENGHRGTKNV